MGEDREAFGRPAREHAGGAEQERRRDHDTPEPARSSDVWDEPWDHDDAPMPDRILAKIGTFLEPDHVLAASDGHRRTLVTCRMLWDDVSRLRTEMATSERDDRLAELQRVQTERDEARAWVRRLAAQGRVLTCVYCGEAYPPGTPDHGAEVLTAHIRTCAKHPMRAMEAERDALRIVLDEAQEIIGESRRDLDALKLELADAGRLLGEVICAGTLAPGERLASPSDHAAVQAIVRIAADRDAWRARATGGPAVAHGAATKAGSQLALGIDPVTGEAVEVPSGVAPAPVPPGQPTPPAQGAAW